MAAKKLSEQVQDVRQLVQAYFKQEAIDPLKNTGRYLIFGILGSFMLGIGVIFLTLAGLRAVQTETDGRLEGNWSWAPYGIVFVVLVLGAALSAKQAMSGKSTPPSGSER